jgi:hypothetical protein
VRDKKRKKKRDRERDAKATGNPGDSDPQEDIEKRNASVEREEI